MIDLLKNFWKIRSVKTGGALESGELEKITRDNALSLPLDFEDYLIHTNGMDAESVDDNFIRFWNAQELQSVDGVFGITCLETSCKWIVFADYSINTAVFAIQADGKGGATRVFFSPETSFHLAGSFSEFLAGCYQKASG